MSGQRSYRFSHALVRKPAHSVASGLRAADCGDPDAAAFSAEHRAYVAALEAAGLTVTVVEALERFPDSVFVEDTALCLASAAILLRPGAPSRAGEVGAIRPHLAEMVGHVDDLPGEGHVDGGDILATGTELLVGLSARTDIAGAEALRPFAERSGYNLRIVQTPAEILHFKTECGLLDAETVFATARLADTGCFADYRVLIAPKGEEAAANLIRVNDVVLVSDGFPQTRRQLERAGYTLVVVPTGQAALLDGGLSCMSLRFSR